MLEQLSGQTRLGGDALEGPFPAPGQEAAGRLSAFTDVLLDTLGALVVMLDRRGRIVRFNRACEEATGYSFEEVRGQMVWDRLLLPEEVEPVRRVFHDLRAGHFPNTHENYWVTRDGHLRLIAWTNTVLLDGEGAVEYVIGTGLDITERRQTETALRESRERLQTIIDAVPALISLVDSEQRYVLNNRAYERWFGRAREEVQGKHMREVLGEEAYAAIRPRAEAALAGETVAYESWVKYAGAGRRYVDVTYVPEITRDGRVRGFVALVHDLTERRLAEQRRAQAEAEQHRLQQALTEERRIATTLARQTLGVPPVIPGLQFSCCYEPADAQARTGGDYYDFIALDHGRVGVVIGDVCGQGLPAALHAISARNMLRAYAREADDPAEVLRRLNRALFHEMTEETPFVTLAYLTLDPEAGVMRYAIAGHPPPLLYDPVRQTYERLLVTGGILGALPEMAFHTETAAFPPGAVLALFTDGVTEAGGPSDPHSDGGVAALLAACGSGDAGAIAEAIRDHVHAQSRGARHDDVAIVVLRRAEGSG